MLKLPKADSKLVNFNRFFTIEFFHGNFKLGFTVFKKNSVLLLKYKEKIE